MRIVEFGGKRRLVLAAADMASSGWRGDEFPLTPEEKAALRITLLKGVEHKGDGIYYVPEKLMTPARIRTLMPEGGSAYFDPSGGDHIQVKRWSAVTGDRYDRGWAILDRRARIAERMRIPIPVGVVGTAPSSKYVREGDFYVYRPETGVSAGSGKRLSARASELPEPPSGERLPGPVDLSHPYPGWTAESLAEEAGKHPDRDGFIRAVMPEYARYGSEKEFMDYHRTGFIESHVYDDYRTSEGLSWLKKDDFPVLLGTMAVGGETVEFRQRGEKLQYAKWDDDRRDAVRDAAGDVVMMTDEEMAAKGLPMYDTTVVAFDAAGKPVGLASNEFGSDGIWVVDAYQGKGIGRLLLRLLRKQFRPKRRIGQMTDAGSRMSRAYYRDMETLAAGLGKIWEQVHAGKLPVNT